MKWFKTNNSFIYRDFAKAEHESGNNRPAWLIFLVSAALIFFCLENGQSWGGDFALYLRQAKSLLEGNIYECLTSNARSMANSDYKLSPDLYPWGFPLLLVPIYNFFGMNLLTMKILEIIFFYLCILIIFLLLEKNLDRTSRLLVIGVFAFNPFLIKFTNHILSDLPGLFFALFSIFLLKKTVTEKKHFINRPASLILLGSSIWLAHFMRPNYMLLVPTLFLAQLVEMKTSGQNFKDYIIGNKVDILPYAVFIILSLISDKILPKGGSYGFYAEFISNMNLEYLMGNIYYTAMLPANFFGGGHTIQRGLYILTLPFAIKGIRLNWKRDYIYVVFFALTAAFFALWPGRQGLRYIFSLLPFYIYFTMLGLKDFQAKRNRKVDLSRVFFCFLLAFFLIQTSFAAYKNMWGGRKTAEGPFTPESAEMFKFIRENTDKEKVMVFFKPRVLMLLAERDAFMSRELSNIAYKGDYLVINRNTEDDQISIESDEFKQKMNSGFFTLAFENSGFFIYRINRTL